MIFRMRLIKNGKISLPLFIATILILFYPKILLRSSPAFVIGDILKFFTKISSTFGEMNAGSVGPSFMFFMPKCKSVSSIQTAFCSYHDKTIDKGNSLTEQPNASLNATATLIALYASLH